MAYEAFDGLKRVIDGVAYNTRTATALGEAWIDDVEISVSGASKRRLQVLFVTRGSRYFLVTWAEVATPEGGCVGASGMLVPFSEDQAKSWLRMHLPDSSEHSRLNLQFEELRSSIGAAVSVRLSGRLKEGITRRAQINGVSANDLYSIYLQHGFSTDIAAPMPNPENYRSEDASSGVCLLNDRGVPVLKGVEGDRSRLDVVRAEYAALFRQFSRTIPSQVRRALIDAIEGSPEELTSNSEGRQAFREQLLRDIVRWLHLADSRASNSHVPSNGDVSAEQESPIAPTLP